MLLTPRERWPGPDGPRSRKSRERCGSTGGEGLDRLARKDLSQPPYSDGSVSVDRTQAALALPTRIVVIDWDSAHLREWVPTNAAELGHPATGKTRWIDVQGLADVANLHALCQALAVHPIIVEDIFDIGQRTKVEIFNEYFFVVVDTFYYTHPDGELQSDQVSMLVFRDLVVTFQQGLRDLFVGVRDKLRTEGTLVRSRGADYFAYTLLDALVDTYFLALEELGERIEAIEDMVAHRPDQDILRAIHRLRGDSILLRKSVWPLREVVNALVRGEAVTISEPTTIYLRDVYDHTVQIVDTLETLRETLSTMLDIYLSSVSNRLNEVMKFLTIISTIFIPITFLAGVYGMNFKYMPELEWRFGYPMVWGIMLASAAGMLYYFRKKGWL